jgi:hypothetical protein
MGKLTGNRLDSGGNISLAKKVGVVPALELGLGSGDKDRKILKIAPKNNCGWLISAY